jgi:hypothetical protein
MYTSATIYTSATRFYKLHCRSSAAEVVVLRRLYALVQGKSSCTLGYQAIDLHLPGWVNRLSGCYAAAYRNMGNCTPPEIQMHIEQCQQQLNGLRGMAEVAGLWDH